MSEERTGPEDRLEGMLRQWGAEEAARRYRHVEPPRRSAVGWTFRVIATWAAVAATLLIAVAVGLLLIGHTLRGGEPPATAPADRQQIDRLETELAKARGELEVLRAGRLKDGKAMVDLMAQLSEQELRYMEDLAELEAELEKLRKGSAGEKAKLAGEMKRLAGRLDAQDKELTAAGAELAKTKAELIAARADAARSVKQMEDLRKRLLAAAAELARAAKTHQDALAAGQQAARELAALKARHRTTVASLQRLYLSVVAPEQPGWGGRQKAAKSAQLLPRCAQLRPSARGEAAARVMDKLEVLLIRLELLDTTDARAVRSFAVLAESHELAGHIDAVLAADDQPPAVQKWLLEVRLILTGAERVA
jgi:hypothetical protein